MSAARAQARGVGRGQRADRLDHPGVVDHGVDAAEGCPRPRHRRLELVERRRRRRPSPRPRPPPARSRAASGRMSAAERASSISAAPSRRRRLGRRRADAAAGAGDDDGLAAQPAHRRSPRAALGIKGAEAPNASDKRMARQGARVVVSRRVSALGSGARHLRSRSCRPHRHVHARAPSRQPIARPSPRAGRRLARPRGAERWPRRSRI